MEVRMLEKPNQRLFRDKIEGTSRNQYERVMRERCAPYVKVLVVAHGGASETCQLYDKRGHTAKQCRGSRDSKCRSQRPREKRDGYEKHEDRTEGKPDENGRKGSGSCWICGETAHLS